MTENYFVKLTDLVIPENRIRFDKKFSYTVVINYNTYHKMFESVNITIKKKDFFSCDIFFNIDKTCQLPQQIQQIFNDDFGSFEHFSKLCYYKYKTQRSYVTYKNPPKKLGKKIKEIIDKIGIHKFFWFKEEKYNKYSISHNSLFGGNKNNSYSIRYQSKNHGAITLGTFYKTNIKLLSCINLDQINTIIKQIALSYMVNK